MQVLGDPPQGLLLPVDLGGPPALPPDPGAGREALRRRVAPARHPAEPAEDATADHEIHDGFHGRFVLQGTLGALSLLHRFEYLGNRRTLDAAQTDPRESQGSFH